MDADASTLRMELMHEAEKQGVVHHFLSLFFHTPTAARFSSVGAARVGVASLEGLVAPLSHANRSRIFPWPELLPKN